MTARNAAGTAATLSTRIVVGRLVRQSFIAGFPRDDGAVQGLLEVGTEPRVVVDVSRTSIGVFRRRLGRSRWETSVGVLRFDTSALGGGLRLESATLVLDVLAARSDGRAHLVVHFCPRVGPIDAQDFRAFAPPGAAARVPIRRIRRGVTAVALSDLESVSLRGMTELCLYISGRVPRGDNAVTFGSRERFWQQPPSLVVAYRVR